MDEDWAKKNIKCCACGGTLETSRFMKAVEIEKLATWKYPVLGRIDIPDYGPRAVAIVCDECIQKKEKIRRCIEWEDSPYQIKYHDIESLEDVDKSESQMKYHFGRLFKTVQQENKNKNGCACQGPIVPRDI